MLKWAIAAFIATGLFAGPAIGAAGLEPGQKPLANIGVGATPCGSFNKIYAADPKWANDNFMSWAQGFISGANAERGRGRVILNAVSPEEAWARLSNYCAAHPKNAFVDGVMVLYRSLPTLP